MCGIFGCVGKIDKLKAYDCINQIKYRGPDSLVVEELEGITLAHSRLSILDISDTANQPMADPSGRYWIVYNGEVYNFFELRKELEELGWYFRTNSDTEVILYSYIEWGEKFQYKCNGMWGIAIWDNVQKELFLSRDRFGVKPLYYYEQDGNFYFASEMKAFFPIMKNRKINYSIFESKNYFSYESTTDCTIRGIKKIKAGHYGYFKIKHLNICKWWDTLDNLVKVPLKYEDQVEWMREVFLDACKIRMRSDVPIGTSLSGGLDSSTVIGAMKHIVDTNRMEINRSWCRAFVASMPGTCIDETQYAEIAANYVGIEIEKVMVTADITPEKLFEYLYICEEPFITSPIPFMQTYNKIAESGIKVTIDGHGADELFGGYSFDIYYAALESGCNLKELKDIWETYNHMSLPESIISYDDFVFKTKNLNVNDNIQLNSEIDFFGPFNQNLYVRSHKNVLPTLLRCYDRYSMGNGVEIRMPFMDYRIVSYALSIPWKSKINGGYSKKIIRDMAVPFMAKEIVYRKAKIGFNSPMTEWLQGNMKEFIFDIIHSKEFYECELFLNPLNVTIKVNEFYKNQKETFDPGQEIWQLLIPFLWKKAMQL